MSVSIYRLIFCSWETRRIVSFQYTAWSFVGFGVFSHANMFGFRHRLGLCGARIIAKGELCWNTTSHTALYRPAKSECMIYQWKTKGDRIETQKCAQKPAVQFRMFSSSWHIPSPSCVKNMTWASGLLVWRWMPLSVQSSRSLSAVFPTSLLRCVWCYWGMGRKICFGTTVNGVIVQNSCPVVSQDVCSPYLFPIIPSSTLKTPSTPWFNGSVIIQD